MNAGFEGGEQTGFGVERGRVPTIGEILERRARETPDGLAIAQLADGQTVSASLSYASLSARASTVAAMLRRRIEPGERAILLYSSPLQFLAAFFGCLRAGVIAIPAPPPEASRLKRTLPRLLAIARDSDAALILCDAPVLDLIERSTPAIGGLAMLPRFDTSSVEPDSVGASCSPEDAPSAAYLQYTSGSVGAPRGVIVGHAELVANLSHNHRLWNYDADSAALHWMPYFHDYGLVEGLLQPIFAGIPVHVMPTVTFLRRPARWLEAISTFGATHSASPNFGYDYCVDRIEVSDRQGLDLSRWRVASNGAEVVRADTLHRFAEAFAPCGFDARAFAPSYGLAEATLLLTAGQSQEGPTLLDADAVALGSGRGRPAKPGERAITLVGCGLPGEGTEIAVVDPETGAAVGDGVIGEIWARGAGVSTGYWNRPDESRATFDCTIAGRGGGFLRTGDLGFLHRGHLFVTGRLKDLIVIRGSNHFPDDIESTARAAHPALSGVDAAAFAVSAEGGEHVALVVEARAGTPAEALADVTDAIRAAVAEAHDVQLRSIVFIRRGTLPKTSSGKIQRSMCRAAFADGSFAFELARFELEAEPERSCLEEPDGRHPDPASAERADAAIAGLRALAEERLNLSLMDERRTPPPHVVLELGNLGILGLQAPVEDGGLALSTPDAMRVLEQIGAIDISVGVMTILQNGLGLRPLMRFGRPGQLDAHLPKLASGRALVAFAYTEPAAGSNVRGIEATARPEGDGIWRLDGTKSWSGSSAWASVINVFAREVDAAGAPRGISAFVARPGVDGLRIGDESLTMGMKATIQSCVEMDGLLLRDEDRLGAPGQGMEIAQDAMMFTRLCLAGLCLGAAKKALRIATRFAAGRHVVTGPLIDHPLTLSRLSGHLAAVRSLEVLVASTATLEDLPDRAPPELLTACKILAPELLWAAADDALQLLAGRGYMEHNLLAMLHRDARAIRIFEGPTEALRHHLGAQLFENVDRLCALVVTLGGDEGLATRLRGFAARQAERPVPAVAVAMGMERPWLAQAAGEVTARALLAALVTKATAQADSAERRALDGAMAWCIARLEEAERAAFTLSPDAVSARDADELVAAVRGFEAAIGNGAYRPAGVERTPDPAITGDDAAPNHHSPSQQGRVAREGMPTSASLAAQSQDHDRDHDLRAWLDCWIADNLKVPRARITPDRPFAALGLDSVTAVNLAMDLEALLGRPVDATLVWDYPTTAKLASHLAGVPAKPASPPLSASEELDGLLKELGER